MDVNRIKTELRGKSFAEVPAERIIEIAEQYANDIKEDAVKNNQIRKFYDVVKNAERKAFKLKSDTPLGDEIIAQLLFLKPHLVNAAKKKKEMAGVSELMKVCISKEYIKTKADSCFKRWDTLEILVYDFYQFSLIFIHF